MIGLLFITARSADAKVVNRLLLHIRDWESGEEDEWDHFMIVRGKDLPPDPPDNGSEDIPPLDYFAKNQWAGATMQEVEEFCIARKPHHHGQIWDALLILDDQGAQDKTIIVAVIAVDHSVATWPHLDADQYHKVRVPWHDAQNVWWSLQFSGDFLDDWCEEKGMWKSKEGGWWTYRSQFQDDDFRSENVERDDIIRGLEKLCLT